MERVHHSPALHGFTPKVVKCLELVLHACQVAVEGNHQSSGGSLVVLLNTVRNPVVFSGARVLGNSDKKNRQPRGKLVGKLHVDNMQAKRPEG